MAHHDKIYHQFSWKNGVLVEKQKIQQDACAVSPVVGVMLMLVVTIIIAAVVSAFSGGFFAASRPAPSAIFDVHIQALEHVGANQSSGFNVPDMSISEISGDAIPTKDLRITTTYTNKSGTTFGGNLSGEVTVSGNDNWYDPNGDWPSLTSTGYIGALILNNGNPLASCIGSSSGGNSCWFGDHAAVLASGQSLATHALVCGNYDGPSDSLTHDNPGMDYLLGFNVVEQENVGGFGPGSVVEVRIVHIPSGKMILDKSVNVE